MGDAFIRPTQNDYESAVRQMDADSKRSWLDRTWTMAKHASSDPLGFLQHTGAPSAIRDRLSDYLGSKRDDRSQMDKALNYAGAYDWGVRPAVNLDDAIEAARLYQLMQYLNQPDRKTDAVWDYLENVQGLESARRDKFQGIDRRYTTPLLEESIRFGELPTGGGLNAVRNIKP